VKSFEDFRVLKQWLATGVKNNFPDQSNLFFKIKNNLGTARILGFCGQIHDWKFW
jgi:hypothetical protein